MDTLRCLEVASGKYEILFGCDEALLTGLTMGASGAVGSTYNFMAPLYLKVIEAFGKGDLVNARKLQTQSIRIVDQLAKYRFLPAAKTLMLLHDLDCGPVRSPLTPLSPEESVQMMDQMKPLIQSITP